MTRARSVFGVTFLVMLGSSLSGVRGQSPGMSLEQQLSASYVPTTVDLNGTVAQAGTVLVLRQAVNARASSLGCYFASSIKNDGQAKGGFIQNCGASPDPPQFRRLAAGEKVYLTAIEVKRTEVLFKVQSCGACNPSVADPDSVPFRAAVSFPFPKGSLDTSDPKQIRETIARVFAIDNTVVPPVGAPPSALPDVTLKLPCAYVSAQTASDQLQLNADHTYSLQEGGQTYRGTFVTNGNTVEIDIPEASTRTTMTIRGGNLIDPGGQVWVSKGQSAPQR